MATPTPIRIRSLHTLRRKEKKRMGLTIVTTESGVRLFTYDEASDIPGFVFGKGHVDQIPEGYEGLSGKWMVISPFSPRPWEVLDKVEEKEIDSLKEEFWGPDISVRATKTMTRDQARARAQARAQRVRDTVRVRVMIIPERFREFPVLDNYIKGGLGDRALIATMVDGNQQVRFTEGKLGNPNDNFDTEPELVEQGHPTVIEGYQFKLLDLIDETDDLSLAEGVSWMPVAAGEWMRLRREIKKQEKEESKKKSKK